MNQRAKKFCEAFAQLFKHQRANGIENPRVGRAAAQAAGYGESSWCPRNAVLTADVMYSKLMKKSTVLDYLKELGLKRDEQGRWVIL